MQLTKMKIEKRDIPVIAFSALGGFLLVVLALASRSIAAAVFVGLVAGAPSGAGGGVLVCMFRRILEKDASTHQQVSTRPTFRVLAGCLSLLMLAIAPVFIYAGITEGAWLAWLIGLVELYTGAGFAGGALTGHWFRFRRRNANTAA